MKSILLCLIAIQMASFIKPTKKFTPPKWEGHWEAYSSNDLNLRTGSLDIKKIKGKEYSFKLIVKSDFDRPVEEEPCPQLEYEGTATYNGANGLNTYTSGISFTYYQETGLIALSHDYTDDKLIELSLCFDPGYFKKID